MWARALPGRSMVLASDVSRILPKVADAGGIFHLTDGHHPSFAEMELALAIAMGMRIPRRLPLGLARAGARFGDAIQRLTGLRVPLNTRTLTKMVSTLTFSDQRAREVIGWEPSRVLDRVGELILR